jgi:uncharacterized protein (DUF488 family)
VRVFTIGHGTRSAEELVAALAEVGARTVVDVRRRLIAELLAARGHEVVHLIRPGRREPHRPSEDAEYRGGKLLLCGYFVA